MALDLQFLLESEGNVTAQDGEHFQALIEAFTAGAERNAVIAELQQLEIPASREEFRSLSSHQHAFIKRASLIYLEYKRSIKLAAGILGGDGSGGPLDNFIVVAKNGDNAIGDGSVGAPYLTVQKAIDEASAGDTIWVCPGTYAEVLDIQTDDLTIFGHSKGVAISGFTLDGASGLRTLNVRWANGSSTAITIQGAGAGDVQVIGGSVTRGVPTAGNSVVITNNDAGAIVFSGLEAMNGGVSVSATVLANPVVIEGLVSGDPRISVATATSTVEARDCANLGLVTHAAGILRLKDIKAFSSSTANAINSTATNGTATNLLHLENVDLRASAGYLLVNKTGNCDWRISDTNRDTANDVLTGSRVAFDRFAVDIASQFTPTKYAVTNGDIDEHIEALHDLFDDIDADEVAVADSGNNFAATDVEDALAELAEKRRAVRESSASFSSVNASGTTSNAWDAAIQALTNHNDGGGNSTTEGVIVNATIPYEIPLRDSTTRAPIDDGSGNPVYGRLSWSGTEYIVSFFSDVDGVETVFNMPATDLDLAYALTSRTFVSTPFFSGFLGEGFVDTIDGSVTINDEQVNVGGFTDLLTGLTTQAQVNAKVDDIGSTANGEGASLVAVETAAFDSLLDGETTVQGALETLDGLGDSTGGQGAELVALDFTPAAGNLLDGDASVGDLADTLDGLKSATKINSNQTWRFGAPLTLTGTDITNKYVDLDGADPDVRSLSDDHAILWVTGGGFMEFGVDFEVLSDGANNRRISWDGLALEAFLEAGDIVKLYYAEIE